MSVARASSPLAPPPHPFLPPFTRLDAFSPPRLAGRAWETSFSLSHSLPTTHAHFKPAPALASPPPHEPPPPTPLTQPTHSTHSPPMHASAALAALVGLATASSVNGAGIVDNLGLFTKLTVSPVPSLSSRPRRRREPGGAKTLRGPRPRGASARLRSNGPLCQLQGDTEGVGEAHRALRKHGARDGGQTRRGRRCCSRGSARQTRPD